MSQFTIYWTENCHYRMTVEGDSREEVLRNFHEGMYDLSTPQPWMTVRQIQDALSRS